MAHGCKGTTLPAAHASIHHPAAPAPADADRPSCAGMNTHIPHTEFAARLLSWFPRQNKLSIRHGRHDGVVDSMPPVAVLAVGRAVIGTQNTNHRCPMLHRVEQTRQM